MTVDLPFNLSAHAHLVQLDARSAAFACGVALLVLGSRVYRLAVVLPGVLGGLWVAEQAAGGLSGTPRLVAWGVLGLAGGVLAHLLERFAVAVAGALVFGGLAESFGPALMGGPAPWYLPAASALVGFVAAPYVYGRFLPVLTAMLGSLAVAWGMGRDHDPIFICLLAAAGLVLQLLLGRGKSKDKK